MWKVTNNMAAGLAGFRLQAWAAHSVVLVLLARLITTVSGQSNSSYLPQVNITESYLTADYNTQFVEGRFPGVSESVTSIRPTRSTAGFGEPSESVELNKTIDTQDEKSTPNYDRKPSVNATEGLSLYGGVSSVIFTRSSTLYKLASIYKLEPETPSKPVPRVPMTSSFMDDMYQPMTSPTKSVTIEPTSLVKPQLYDPFVQSDSSQPGSLQSRSQYSRFQEGFADWASSGVALQSTDTWSDFQTGAMYPSHYYASPSSAPPPEFSSSYSSGVLTGYPELSSSAPVYITSSVKSQSVMPSYPPVPSTEQVTPTDALDSQQSALPILSSSQSSYPTASVSATYVVPSDNFTAPLSPSSEPVTDSLFTSEIPVTSIPPYVTDASSLYLSTTPELSSSALAWSDYLNITGASSSYLMSNSVIVLPSTTGGGWSDIPSLEVTSSLEASSSSVLYPSPVITPSVTSQTVAEISLRMYTEGSPEFTWSINETYLPSDEAIYPTTDGVYTAPSRYVSEYDEIPATWSDFPTESYYTDDYFYEETSVSRFTQEQTERLSEMQTSSTLSVGSTVEWVETAASADDATHSTDDVSDTVFPVSPTVQVMPTSAHTPEPSASVIIERSSQAPDVTTHRVTPVPRYTNQKFVLTFNGDCQPIVSNAEKAQEFQSKVKVFILDYLDLDANNVYMDRVACGSVKSYVVIYNATQNYSTEMSTIVSSGTFLVDMTFPDSNSSQIFRAYKVEEVDFSDPGSTERDSEPAEHHLGEKDIVLIVLACVICAVLIIIGVVVCARHMYSKKYAQSFNLMDTRHASLKMDDYTLTQFPLPRRSYGEDGIRVQSYSHYHSNGQALLPPLQHNYGNHSQSSDLDSTLERSVDVGDIRLDGGKPSSFGPAARTFEFTANGTHLSGKVDSDVPLPSTSMDSSSSTHDRSTENLVPGLNGSALHGSVNPIYSGDETEGTGSVSSDPPPYTDDNPVNM